MVLQRKTIQPGQKRAPADFDPAGAFCVEVTFHEVQVMLNTSKVRGQWMCTLPSGREAFRLRNEVTKVYTSFATQGVASSSSFIEKVLYRQGVIDGAEIMWNGAAGDMQLAADVSDEIDAAFEEIRIDGYDGAEGISIEVDAAFDGMLKKTGPMVLVPAENMTTGYKFKRWVPCSTYEVN